MPGPHAARIPLPRPLRSKTIPCAASIELSAGLTPRYGSVFGGKPVVYDPISARRGHAERRFGTGMLLQLEIQLAEVGDASCVAGESLLDLLGADKRCLARHDCTPCLRSI